MSNTIIRQWATRQQLNQLKAILRSVYIEGEDAAGLIDELHHSLSNSAWRHVGSSDLEAVADQMRNDCAAFSDQQVEFHTQRRAA